MADDITDLIFPEEDFMVFETPNIDLIKSAYSKKFRKKNTSRITHINELFPKKPPKPQQIKEDPGYDIVPDDDILDI